MKNAIQKKRLLYIIFALVCACFFFSCADDSEEYGTVSLAVARSGSLENPQLAVVISGGYSYTATTALSSTVRIDDVPVGAVISISVLIGTGEEGYCGSIKNYTVQSGNNVVPIEAKKPVLSIFPEDAVQDASGNGGQLEYSEGNVTLSLNVDLPGATFVWSFTPEYSSTSLKKQSTSSSYSIPVEDLYAITTTGTFSGTAQCTYTLGNLNGVCKLYKIHITSGS